MNEATRQPFGSFGGKTFDCKTSTLDVGDNFIFFKEILPGEAWCICGCSYIIKEEKPL